MRGAKRSFWRLPRLTFERRLAQSARSGDFRGSLLKEVWHKTLVLETSAAPLGKKSRAKRALSLSLSLSLSLCLSLSLSLSL